jgi:CrcB protein
MAAIFVFLGGGIGALLRYFVSLLTDKVASTTLPMATLISNVVASFLLGVFVALLKDKIHHSDYWYAFLVIGVCGGFSTFSSFAKENLALIEKGQFVYAGLNILVSVVLCILAVYIGKR